MMKNYFLFLGLLLVFSASKCGRKSGFELGQPVRMQIGEKAQCQCPGPVIQLTAIKEDSRCPEYTNCIWEGQAVIQLLIEEATPQYIDLTLREGHPELSSKKAGNFIYRLEEVSPYPQAGKTIKPEEYVVVLTVESI